MKLLHVVPSYYPAVRYGGPIVSVHGLCRALAAAGHEVHVFTTNLDGPGTSDVPLNRPVDLDGVHVRYFPCSRLRRLYHSPAMRRELDARVGEFDVVHLHSIFLWPTWAAARAARRAGRPYVLAPRGMLERDLIRRRSSFAKKAWIALIERNNIEHAAALHATSERERLEAEAFGFRLPPVEVIPNGVDLPADDDETGAPPSDGGYVLYLGRINWKKGLDRLIAALPHVPHARLVIAGNDEEDHEKTLRAQAAAAGVASRVDFRGPVHGAAKWALYRRAGVFVLPSYSENFGNVVLEAMACRVPVVVTPEVGVAPVVQESHAGCVVDGDPESLGRALDALLRDPARREAMGRRGFSFVREGYSWSSVAREMSRVYGDIAQRGVRNGRLAVE